jgi:hypothetical protein
MQCSVEFGYQLSICSWTKENHEETWNGQSQDLPDANRLPACSQALNARTLTLVPISAALLKQWCTHFISAALLKQWCTHFFLCVWFGWAPTSEEGCGHVLASGTVSISPWWNVGIKSKTWAEIWTQDLLNTYKNSPDLTTTFNVLWSGYYVWDVLLLF